MNTLTPLAPENALSLPVAATCPKCSREYLPRRSNQRYCGAACQKSASRNSARGSRLRENAQRNREHYGRAAWLCYDLNRTRPDQRVSFVEALILAARKHDAALRNILTDPALLGAAPDSAIGKLYPDSANHQVKNIAKSANAYCRARWGLEIKAVVSGMSELRDAPPPRLSDLEGAKRPPPIMPDGWDFRLLLSGKWPGHARSAVMA